jgi:hypothetical protein
MPTIEDGRNAIAQGNLQQARLIFEAILQENPRTEDAWLALADVMTETNDKRICYENALKINKNNRAARDGLRNLEPQEDPFVMAMRQQQEGATPVEEEIFPTETEEMATSPGLEPVAAEEAGGQTPTVVLVALGLGLSVIVFAVGAGVVFYVLTAVVNR